MEHGYRSLSPAIPEDLSDLSAEEKNILISRQEEFVRICERDTENARRRCLAHGLLLDGFYYAEHRMLIEARANLFRLMLN